MASVLAIEIYISTETSVCKANDQNGNVKRKRKKDETNKFHRQSFKFWMSVRHHVNETMTCATLHMCVCVVCASTHSMYCDGMRVRCLCVRANAGWLVYVES